MSSVGTPVSALEAVEQLDAALALALAGAADLAVGDPDGALALTRSVERAGRRMAALQIAVVAAVDDRAVYGPDGHASATAMVGHTANLAADEARRRGQARRALADLPVVAAWFRDGSIGRCQVQRIAQVHANPRVRSRFIELDEQIARVAARETYDELDRRLRNWVLENDEDGSAQRSERNHEQRDARIVDHYDTSWHLMGNFGSLDGAQLHAIHCAFIEAEFQADWAEAVAVHGDATTIAHLPRTDAQRRADAITKIFRAAADAWAAASGGSSIDTHVVIDQATFERHLRRIAGEDVPPIDDVELDPEPAAPSSTEVGRRCETIDGRPLDPTEVVANALVGRVRRVVLGADGVVIDLGRRQRIFTGPARLAVLLSRTTCYWPGCRVPASRCQSDHLLGWKGGGSTSPDNGAPLCGRHNRHKEHGFTVRRDERGHLHVHRPDGTEIG